MSADVLVLEADALQIASAHLLDEVAGEHRALGEQLLVGLLVVQVGQNFLAVQQIRETLGALVVQNALLVFEVALQTALPDSCRIGLRALVELRALAGEDLGIDDDALDTRRAVERGVLHVAGLFAEDRAEQLLFRSQLGFAFRRDLADQNVARLHRSRRSRMMPLRPGSGGSSRRCSEYRA